MLVPDREGMWYLGEDYAFCERAHQAGYQVFADTTIRVDHLGTYRYSWEDAGTDVKRYATYRFDLSPAAARQSVVYRPHSKDG
jgi:hypothetical protein